MKSYYNGAATFLSLLYLDMTKSDLFPVVRGRPVFKNWKGAITVRAKKEDSLGSFGTLELAPKYDPEADEEGLLKLKITRIILEYFQVIDKKFKMVDDLKQFLSKKITEGLSKFPNKKTLISYQSRMKQVFRINEGDVDEKLEKKSEDDEKKVDETLEKKAEDKEIKVKNDSKMVECEKEAADDDDDYVNDDDNDNADDDDHDDDDNDDDDDDKDKDKHDDDDDDDDDEEEEEEEKTESDEDDEVSGHENENEANSNEEEVQLDQDDEGKGKGPEDVVKEVCEGADNSDEDVEKVVIAEEQASLTQWRRLVRRRSLRREKKLIMRSAKVAMDSPYVNRLMAVSDLLTNSELALAMDLFSMQRNPCDLVFEVKKVCWTVHHVTLESLCPDLYVEAGVIDTWSFILNLERKYRDPASRTKFFFPTSIIVS
ncbi:uncharacterized protein [Rutidosis leptorrhynchoides]|uniref:uncharacterized protein n=1 Tax=Rutidosis leptorrhynchoides TaxID=125765 RepID=UPI003A98E7FC